MGTESNLHAVIMGDLVKSERALAPDMLHETFNRQVSAANHAFQTSLISPLTITLGDEFQGLLATLAQAVPLMRSLRLNLLKESIDCRFVLGLADIRTPINSDKAWNMMGPGLSRARDKLNEKATTTLYRFSLPEDPVTETLLDAVGAGLTAIETRWTDQQRDDIAALMDNPSAKSLAERRGVSIHNIYKVRSSGNYDAYRLQWQAITTALANADHAKGMADHR